MIQPGLRQMSLCVGTCLGIWEKSGDEQVSVVLCMVCRWIMVVVVW